MEEEQNNEGNEESGFARFKRKVKEHVEENKKTWILVCVSGLVSGGVTYIVMKSRYGNIQKMLEGSDLGSAIVVSPMSLLSNGQTSDVKITQQTISIYGNKIGRPGIPIIDTTTNKRYESISLAADALGLGINNIRDQLHGRKDHVNGHMFELAE